MNLLIKTASLVLFLGCIVGTVNAGEVAKDVWMNAMSTALPTTFCMSKQYFSECFEVTQVECEETALSATRICLEKYKEKLPNLLIQPKDTSHWGGIIGRCAAESYGAAFNKRQISSKLCNDVANWK